MTDKAEVRDATAMLAALRAGDATAFVSGEVDPKHPSERITVDGRFDLVEVAARFRAYLSAAEENPEK